MRGRRVRARNRNDGGRRADYNVAKSRSKMLQNISLPGSCGLSLAADCRANGLHCRLDASTADTSFDAPHTVVWCHA